jgi:hypothetical protein
VIRSDAELNCDLVSVLTPLNPPVDLAESGGVLAQVALYLGPRVDRRSRRFRSCILTVNSASA